MSKNGQIATSKPNLTNTTIGSLDIIVAKRPDVQAAKTLRNADDLVNSHTQHTPQVGCWMWSTVLALSLQSPQNYAMCLH